MNNKAHLFRSIFKSWFFLMTFALAFTSKAKADSLEITSFGHSALLIKGGGHSVLINPFQPVACAEGLKKPSVRADVILASSELADEGSRSYSGTFFVEPGSYDIRGLSLQGLSAPHDRVGGRRFGQSTSWQWNQGGVNFVHLGGSVAPVRFQEKLFYGRPDVLFLAVGGGSKVYSGQEAAEVVRYLNPKIVIPVQYVRGKTPANCDQTGVQPFLDSLDNITVKKVGKTYKIPRKLGDQTVINLMP